MLTKTFSFAFEVSNPTNPIVAIIKNNTTGKYLATDFKWYDYNAVGKTFPADFLQTLSEDANQKGTFVFTSAYDTTFDIWNGSVTITAYKQNDATFSFTTDLVGSKSTTHEYINDVLAENVGTYKGKIESGKAISFDFDKVKHLYPPHIGVRYENSTYDLLDITNLDLDGRLNINKALTPNTIYTPCTERLFVVEILDSRLIIKHTSSSALTEYEAVDKLMISKFPITKGEQLTSLDVTSFKTIATGIDASTKVFIVNNILFYFNGTTLMQFDKISETFSEKVVWDTISTCKTYCYDSTSKSMLFFCHDIDGVGIHGLYSFDGDSFTLKSKFSYGVGSATPNTYYLVGFSNNEYTVRISANYQNEADITIPTSTSPVNEITFTEDLVTEGYLAIYGNSSQNIIQSKVLQYVDYGDSQLNTQFHTYWVHYDPSSMICFGWGAKITPTSKFFCTFDWPMFLFKMPELKIIFAYGNCAYGGHVDTEYPLLMATQYPLTAYNCACNTYLNKSSRIIESNVDEGTFVSLMEFDRTNPLLNDTSSTTKDIENSTFIKTILPTSLTVNEGKNVVGDITNIKYLDGSSFQITTDETTNQGIDVLVQCNIPLDFYSGSAILNVIGTYSSNGDISYHADVKVYNWDTAIYEYTSPQLELFENTSNKTFYTTQLSTKHIAPDGRVLIKLLHDYDGLSIGVGHILTIDKIEIVVKKIDESIEVVKSINSIAQVKSVLPSDFEVVAGTSVEEDGTTTRTPFLTDICYYNEPALIVAEDVTNGIEVDVDFDIPLDYYSTEAKLVTIASYNAQGDHYMKVQLYNNLTSQWEDSTDSVAINSANTRMSYTTSITDAQINDSGLVKVKYIHSATTYADGDLFKLQKAEVIIPKVQAQPEQRTEFWA